MKENCHNKLMIVCLCKQTQKEEFSMINNARYISNGRLFLVFREAFTYVNVINTAQ